MNAVNTPAEILLNRGANWYCFQILPDGVGSGKPTFSDMNLAILCYCDLTPAYKVFHSLSWTPRHDRIAKRMSSMLLHS